MTILTGGEIIGTGRVARITIRSGFIAAVDEVKGDRDPRQFVGTGDPDTDDEVIDVTGLSVSPGLIDLQINGAYGADFTSDPHSIWQVGARLPEQGVTAFLPTIITSPPATVEMAFAAIDGRPSGYRGAEPLGLHLEGPMLSTKRPGVHNPELMRPPSLDLIQEWTPTSGVAMVTLAPELPGAEAVVKSLADSGVIVSAGHTAATVEEAAAGFGWGIGTVTHLFNAMEPFDHRAPGLIGALLEHRWAIAGLIADGIHSHPAAVIAAWKWLGPSRLALVTDAMAATGLGDGHYELGSIKVNVKGGRASDANGRLAGSTLTLDQAVRNLVEYTGCPIVEAVAAASAVPAGAVGMVDRGHLAVGKRADLVLFDKSTEVMATMIGGEIVYRREGWRR